MNPPSATAAPAKRAVFRVDSSTQIGSGHLVRCLTLAAKLRSHGFTCTFLSRRLPGTLMDKATENGHELVELPSPPATPAVNQDTDAFQPPHRHWLGVSSEHEVRDLENALAPLGNFDLAVVDHYALWAPHEAVLKRHAQLLLAIDDLADRPHLADAVLDQNFHLEPQMRYERFIAPATTLFCGPRFALLRDAFAEHLKTQTRQSTELKSVLVFFGGMDEPNLTGLLLDALNLAPEILHGRHFTVVIGEGNPHAQTLLAQADRFPAVRFLRAPQDMVQQMGQADLFIGAGGTTTWERCCMGLASLVVTIADNQISTTQAMHDHGYLIHLGDWRQINAPRLSRDLTEIFARDPQTVLSLGQRSRQLCDGRGAEHVSLHLMGMLQSRLDGKAVELPNL